MIDIKERLRARFFDTKNMIKDRLCHEAADHIEQQEALIAELHTSLAGAVQHGEQGWQRYESANKMCISQQTEIVGLNQVIVELRKDAVTVLSLLDTIDSKQSEIDALMLEFCPNEMTKEQLEEWAKHQKVSDYQPPRQFEHTELSNPWLSIDVDGQPETAGFYDVLYSWEESEAPLCTLYYDGKSWYCSISPKFTASFGNSYTEGEYYRKSDKSEISIVIQ